MSSQSPVYPPMVAQWGDDWTPTTLEGEEGQWWEPDPITCSHLETVFEVNAPTVIGLAPLRNTDSTLRVEGRCPQAGTIKMLGFVHPEKSSLWPYQQSLLRLAWTAQGPLPPVQELGIMHWIDNTAGVKTGLAIGDKSWQVPVLEPWSSGVETLGISTAGIDQRFPFLTWADPRHVAPVLDYDLPGLAEGFNEHRREVTAACLRVFELFSSRPSDLQCAQAAKRALHIVRYGGNQRGDAPSLAARCEPSALGVAFREVLSRWRPIRTLP